MKLQITTRRFDMDQDLRSFTETRVLKLKRYFDHIIDVNVILATEKHRQSAEVTLHATGSSFVGASESGDMRTSIEEAVSRIEAQLKKLKDKRARDRRGRTSLGEAMAAEVEGLSTADGDDDLED